MATKSKSSSKKSSKYVYFFGGGKADGNGGQKPLLGGKGANLHEMTRIGLPVPPGFTITTEVCTYYYANKKTLPEGADRAGERGAGQARSGHRQEVRRPPGPAAGVACVRARANRCPGMMDTILNLGLNDETVEVLAKKSGNARLGVGLLSPVRADVRRRRHGRAEGRQGRSRAV